jgi:hypothetical protein
MPVQRLLMAVFNEPADNILFNLNADFSLMVKTTFVIFFENSAYA